MLKPLYRFRRYKAKIEKSSSKKSAEEDDQDNDTEGTADTVYVRHLSYAGMKTMVEREKMKMGRKKNKDKKRTIINRRERHKS